MEAARQRPEAARAAGGWGNRDGGGAAKLPRRREVEDEVGTGLQFQKSSGAGLKTIISHCSRVQMKSAQNESCSVFQDLQLSCVQISTRSKDLKIFSKIQMNSN